MPNVIALDGPAGAGKSTAARLLASRLGYHYLDTGALYRAVTWYLLKNRVAPEDQDGIARTIGPVDFRLASGRVLVANEDVTDEIRSMEVARVVSRVSECGAVRDKLLSIQRAQAQRDDVVVEGRDIGTVVFPRAFLKVYVDAVAEIRAARRADELRGTGSEVDFDEVLENLEARDRQDAQRKIAPLQRAADAAYLDTSYLDHDTMIDVLVQLVALKRERASRPAKWAFYWFVHTLFKLIGSTYLRVRGHNIEHVTGVKGPMILAANHQSHLDPPLVAISLPGSQQLHYLAKRELFKPFLFGRCCSALNAIPVRRGILDRDAHHRMLAILASGGRIVVFPEGTRSRDGDIHEARSGFGKLVLESGAPVVPVRIEGSFKSLPPGAAFPRPGRIDVTYGEPWRVRESAPAGETLRDKYDDISRRVTELIRGLRPPA